MQAGKDLAAWDTGPMTLNSSYVWNSSLGLEDSLTMALTLVPDQGTKDTRRGLSATSSSFILKGNS